MKKRKYKYRPRPRIAKKPYSMPREERFWSYVDRKDNDCCWIWNGATSKGYGTFWDGERQVRANRYAFNISNSIPLSRTEEACHTCDNPRCVNPNHLWRGSHIDNVKDCVKKGRHRSGEKCMNSHLTNSEAEEIRERVANGEVQRKIAFEKGVHVVTINKIVKGKTYKTYS